ncbi:hypothetical protein, partial [uncultured Alistipes sp.]|uniref:hypothetical protein n=1 Tax=uncultured Alistipes sp. TaxID=538949 RepID=UPI002596B24C
MVTSISFSSFIVGILPAKITINHAHGRYFHAALAPNEKNFVYLQSLTGRISTSFIGRYAVAGTQGRHSPSGVPGTRDYGSGYPYGTAGAAGMLGAKHIKFVATMNKDAIIKLVNEQM